LLFNRLSKQDLIRLAVSSLLSEKYDKDIEKVAIERMKQKQKQYEETNYLAYGFITCTPPRQKPCYPGSTRQ
jgi:hypothetical protein